MTTSNFESPRALKFHIEVCNEVDRSQTGILTLRGGNTTLLLF